MDPSSRQGQAGPPLQQPPGGNAVGNSYQPGAAGQYYPPAGPMTGGSASGLPHGQQYPGYNTASPPPGPGIAPAPNTRAMQLHGASPPPSTAGYQQPPPLSSSGAAAPLSKLHMPPGNMSGPGPSSAGTNSYPPPAVGSPHPPSGPYTAPAASAGSNQQPNFLANQQRPSAGPGGVPPQPSSGTAPGMPPMPAAFQLPPTVSQAPAVVGPPPTGGSAVTSQPLSQRGRYPQPVAQQPAASAATPGPAPIPTAGGPTLLDRANSQPSSQPQPAGPFPPSVQQPTSQPQPAGPFPPAHHHQPPTGATGPQPYAQPGGHMQQPGQPAATHQGQVNAMTQGMANMDTGGQQAATLAVNVLGDRTILPSQPIPPPKPTGTDFRGVVLPDPDYVRPTLSVVPATRQLLDSCRLPLGVVLQPFRQMSATEIPVIRHLVMVRCTGCRAYFNPFVTFLNSHQWQCNLCFRTNEVPDSFYQADAKAENHRNRPELRCCAVEYLAPREYTTRPPPPATYVFVIEVTAASQRINLLENVCALLGKHFAAVPGDKRRVISIITYGKGITFYAFKPNAVQPQMYVVNDLEEIMLPVPGSDLKVNVEEYEGMLIDFFEQLPGMHDGNADTENCLGSALQAAFQLVCGIGGRVTLFQASLPNVGEGALKPASPAATEPRVDASSGFYKEQSLEFNQNQCAVDVFAFGVQPVDLATTGDVSRFSSGQVYFYSDLLTSAVPHGERFHRDFSTYLTRPIGFEAIMRLRCSYGVSIESFFGNFFHRGSDVLNMPNLNPDLTVGVQLTIEDKLPRKKPYISLQSAVLYTTHTGERRTRVTTLAIPTSTNATEVFVGADVEGIALMVAKMAAASAPTGLADAREAVTTCVVDLLQSYQKNVVGRSPTALLFPQSLSTLPLFFTGMLNSTAFSKEHSLSNDDRVYGLRLLEQLPISQALRCIYPRMYPVHDLGEEHATARDCTVHYSPARLQASSLNLNPAGIFLLDVGVTLYLWIGQNVADEIIQDLFDVASVSALPETQGYLPMMDNPRSVALNTFIRQLRRSGALHAPLFIVRADSHSSSRVLRLLVDDGDHGVQTYSYYNFLSRLQKAISQ